MSAVADLDQWIVGIEVFEPVLGGRRFVAG
jgi:hypothetical protein